MRDTSVQFSKVSLKITDIKLNWNHPGANELNVNARSQRGFLWSINDLCNHQLPTYHRLSCRETKRLIAFPRVGYFANLQTTFSSSLSCTKIIVFWFKLHWNYFPRFPINYASIGLDSGSVLIRLQTIIWTALLYHIPHCYEANV